MDTPAASLRIHHATVFVRDQDRSLEFFRDQLGFRVVADYRFNGNDRFVLVEPPDGTTSLALVGPKPGSADFARIGQSGRIIFVTDDIHAKFQEWESRGVQFHRRPTNEIWGGVLTSFEDVDGNLFILAGWDAITREVEEKRRAAAEQLQRERRAEIELALAREVQGRLFPQGAPPARTLDYTGVCIQARAVGGDYYDFLNLGSGHLGLIVGDVSGKGIAAALMMSNLQANLRSQSAVARDELARALTTVSRLFYENTPSAAFATLFFGLYSEEDGGFTYANCGHPPALLMRHSGGVERLNPTAAVVGMFPDWTCAVEQSALDPGDTVVMFTDGVTEAFDEAGEEFGEDRLIAAITEHREKPPKELAGAVLEELTRFGGCDQNDDITMVIARRRNAT